MIEVASYAGDTETICNVVHVIIIKVQGKLIITITTAKKKKTS